MNKKQFLKRCETAYDMGLVSHDGLRHVLDCCVAIMRYKAGRGDTDGCKHQMEYFTDFIEKEDKRTDKVLASDDEAYKNIELMSLIAHPCQKCAEDASQWHTRWAYCPHDKK